MSLGQSFDFVIPGRKMKKCGSVCRILGQTPPGCVLFDLKGSTQVKKKKDFSLIS
jgi:hypothetical protein